MSFTVDDVIRYTKIYKKVAIDNTRIFPFIKNIRFPKLTRKEIEKVFDILRSNNIIAPIFNPLDRPGKQIAFVISDDDLQDLINQIWRIRNLELQRIDKKLSYVGGPTNEEKEWLEVTYGSNYASIIIHDTARYRNEDKGKRVISQIERRVKSLEDRINQQILNIKETYRKVIARFNFPPDLLDDICLNKIF